MIRMKASGWLRGVALGGGLALASCSGGTSTPCSGTSCPDVSGQYLFTLTPPIQCPSWQEHTQESSYMDVTNSNGALNVTLWSTGTHPHYFTGTLTKDGAVSVSEPTTNQQLGIPTGNLTGSFAPAQGNSGPPFAFRGTLSLTQAGAAGGGGDGGANANCAAHVTLQAEEVPTGAVADAGPPDAGPPDAGAHDAGTPDGGTPDAGIPDGGH